MPGPERQIFMYRIKFQREIKKIQNDKNIDLSARTRLITKITQIFSSTSLENYSNS